MCSTGQRDLKITRNCIKIYIVDVLSDLQTLAFPIIRDRIY